MSQIFKRLLSTQVSVSQQPDSDNVTATLPPPAGTATGSHEQLSLSTNKPGGWLASLSTPDFLRLITLLSGASLVATSLWLYTQPWLADNSGFSWVMLIVGIILFITSAWLIQGKSLPSWFESLFVRLTSILGVTRWQVIALVLSPIMTWLACLAAGFDIKMNNPPLAVAAWIVGIGLAIIGGWQVAATKTQPQPRVAVTILLLVLGAFLIRGINTTHIPVALSGDEASAGLSAIDFLQGKANNIFRAGWFSFPALFPFLQSLSIAIFGQTSPALRLPAALVGAITVGAVYWLACAMFGKRTALFSALFLAVFHFHNHFSRLGLNNIWDGFWYVIVLGTMWYGWQKEDRRAFLFSGFALGLAQYFYVTSRLLIVLVPLWLLLVGVFDRSRLKKNLTSLILLGVVTSATVLPLARFFWEFPEEFWAPMRRVSLLGDWLGYAELNSNQPAWLILLRQIGISLLGYAHRPIRMWYDPGTPLLRPASATLFFLGISLLLLKLREERTFLIGFWLIGLSLVGGLSESTPAAQRYVAVAPAVALVIGYALSETAGYLTHLWKRHTRLIYTLALVVMLLISADELRFYYLEYTPRGNFGGENTLVAQRLADYLQSKSSKWKVLFFGYPRMGYASIASLPFLASHIQGYDMNNPWGSPLNPTPTSDHLLFVFLPGLENELSAVKQSYPHGNLHREQGADEKVLYWLYQVPSEPTTLYNPNTVPPLTQGGYP